MYKACSLVFAELYQQGNTARLPSFTVFRAAGHVWSLSQVHSACVSRAQYTHRKLKTFTHTQISFFHFFFRRPGATCWGLLSPTREGCFSVEKQPFSQPVGYDRHTVWAPASWCRASPGRRSRRNPATFRVRPRPWQRATPGIPAGR